jgi:hypothetical protein
MVTIVYVALLAIGMGGDTTGAPAILAVCDAPLLADLAPPKTKSALKRMEPQRRAKVLAALAALIILGLGMMVLAWLGARWARHHMNRAPILRENPPQSTPVREKDWAEKPLSSPFEEEET